jgi:hypothetical protein
MEDLRRGCSGHDLFIWNRIIAQYGILYKMITTYRKKRGGPPSLLKKKLPTHFYPGPPLAPNYDFVMLIIMHTNIAQM